MANEALAPVAPSEDEYDAFHTALSASARGRAFLAEHGRRQRLADTDMLLGALSRLETQIAAPLSQDTAGADLNELTEAIQGLVAEMSASNARMAELAAVVDALKASIDGTANAPAPGPETAPPARVEPVAVPTQVISMPEVSWQDGPPAAAPTPAQTAAARDEASAPAATSALAFVAELAERDAAAREEEAAQDDVEEEETPPEATIIKAGMMPTPTPFAGEDFSSAPAVKTVPNTDLLGAIMALSDDERTALFT